MSRKIIVADSLQWLKKLHDKSIPNILTGICDLDETDMEMTGYLDFFNRVVQLIFNKVDPDGYVVFIQTDRKYQRQWIDKSFIISDIANRNGFKMAWHKIILHREVGRTDLHRPTYAHMLCYTVNGTTGSAFPDVLPVSSKLYKNGTPILAARSALEFIKQYNKVSSLVLDPFVGQGTVPAIANALGMDSIGIDIDPEQAKIAETMTYQD